MSAPPAENPGILLSACESFIRNVVGQSLPNVNPVFMCLVPALQAGSAIKRRRTRILCPSICFHKHLWRT